MRPFLLLACGLQVAHESRRAQLHDFLAGGATHGEVGGDEADPFLAPKFSGKPLEQRVRVPGVPDLERPVRPFLPDAVEDDHAAGAPEGNEARKPIDELAWIGERPGVQDVVAVEEVKGRLSHRCAASGPRTAERRPQR